MIAKWIRVVARMYPLLVTTTVIACVAAPAAAQTPGPYRGLFGPTSRDVARPTQLMLDASVYAGVDDTTQFATGGVLDESLQTGRLHEGATMSLSFSRRRARSTIALFGSSAVRYYSTLNRVTTQRHGGGFGWGFQASKQLQVRFAQTASYSPSYQLTLGQPLRQEGSELTFAPVGVDFTLARDKQVTYGAMAGATYTWNLNRELMVGSTFGYTDFFTGSDSKTRQAAARFTQRLSKDVALRLGYGVGSGQLIGVQPVLNHDIDIGLNYSRSIAFSPRTTLAFSSGSTVVSSGGQRRFEIIGGAQLRRRLSPRWVSGVRYQRGLVAIDRMPVPFVAATLSGELSGLFGPRVSLSVNPSYSMGSDVVDASRTFTSAFGQTRLDTAISRNWALYVEHFFYQYRFAQSAGLPSALAPGLTRQGLRFGLAIWAPVIR